MKKPVDPAQEKRRLSRLEKRERQRAMNEPRALKMRKLRLEADKFARMDSDTAPPAVNSGCSGWFYWEWRGKFYPQGMPTKDWFAHYASQLQTVEINASFYSWPTEANVKSWARQAAGKKFIYTVKVCELITHVKKFTGTKTLVQDFYHIAHLLGPHMGCFLFQLPPGYEFTPARLKNILSQLDPRHRNVVEFRHASWWNEKVYAAFRKSGAIFCIVSAPKLPDDFVKTADDVYIRFHGREKWYKDNYDAAALGAWAKKVKASGVKRVWAYFNNTYDGDAPNNAATFARLLRK